MRKSALFMKHLPYIENKILDGYKLDEVVMLLKLEHGFDMKSSSNLSNYLSRFRNKSEEQTEKKTEKIIIKPSVHITQHQPQQQELQDDEIDIETLKQLEAELITDKARILKPKSIFRSDSKSEDDDENVSPEVLAELKAKLQKTKNSLASKSLFDRS